MFKIFTACLWASTLGKALAIEPPLPGYSVEVLQWEVMTSLNGCVVTLNGTVQDVHQQLLRINPKYEAEFGIPEESSVRTLNKTSGSFSVLNNVDTWTNCGGFAVAEEDAIWEGINYLNKVPSRPGSTPGPGVCGRVSCSWDSAIWWCNDDDDYKTLSSFHVIASSAQSLIMNCSWWEAENEPVVDQEISGQQFHSDKWSVVIRGAIC